MIVADLGPCPDCGMPLQVEAVRMLRSVDGDSATAVVELVGHEDCWDRDGDS